MKPPLLVSLPTLSLHGHVHQWRLLDASEREFLLGFGFGHTSLCWGASADKNDLQGFEIRGRVFGGIRLACCPSLQCWRVAYSGRLTPFLWNTQWNVLV